jgi:ABC-type phosphate transport system substrate-binding protein
VRSRKTRLALAAGAAALSLTLLVPAVSPSPAEAAPKKVKPLTLAGTGSDTTYWMMRRISGKFAKSKKNIHKNKYVQIPPTNDAPFPASVTSPKDYVTSAWTFDSSAANKTPPNGSSAGVTALRNDKVGLYDYARSSRGPNPGETSSMDFWAYALGAVDWVKFPGSLSPAGGLTQAQLIGIYTCDPGTGLPFFDDWSDVGGSPGPIVKYAAQPGSGTKSYFDTTMLNGSAVDKNCDASHKSILLQEHDARGVTAGSFPNAIYYYDWARYNAQKKGFEANLTNSAELGAFGVTTPVVPTAANVNEKSTRFYGTRYVYNVVRRVNHPKNAASQYQDNLAFVGVKPAKQGGAGWICNGHAKADIIAAGFVPLAKFGTGSLALPKSYCRANPKPL